MTIRHSFIAFLCLVLSSTPVKSSADESTLLSSTTTVLRGKVEPVQWTPESVTVLSADMLNATYFYALEDIEGLVPALLVDPISSAPRGAAISLRGVGSAESSYGFFPAVALNVDGIYSGTHASQNPLLFDVESIEVMRGPQGTFAGAPALGGSVNLYRTKPTGRLEARTRISFGDFSRRRFDGVFNFPVVNDIAGKIAVNWARRGSSLVRNDFSGRKENEEHLTAASLSLLWRSDAVSVQYTLDDSSDKSDVPALLNLSVLADLLCAGSPDGTYCSVDGAGLKPANDARESTTQNFSNNRLYDVTQHAIEVGFSHWGVGFKSLTSFRRTEERSSQDLDATFIDFYSSIRDQDYDQFTQELTAVGQISPETDFVAGLFVLTNEYKLDRTDHFVLGSLAAAGIAAPAAPADLRTINSRQENRIVSIFGHAEHESNEQWKHDIGMRFSFVRNELDHSVTRTNQAVPAVVADADEYNEFTWSLGSSYKVDENAMIYMRVARAFRPGLQDDAANSAAAVSSLQAENTTNIELGLKSEWFGDRLRVNAVTYNNTLRDKVERYPELLSSGSVESVLGNASEARYRGHDIEIESVPMENLVLRASLSHLNGDYVRYMVPDLADATTRIDKEGLVPALSSPGMYHFSGIYTFPFDQGHISVYAAYTHVKEYWSRPEVAAGRIDNSTFLDLSVVYRFSNWHFRVFSHNLNNNRFLMNASRPEAAEFASLPASTTASQYLVTSAELSQPRFTGFEIIYTPRFQR